MATLQPVVEHSSSRSSRWAHWFGRFEAWLERVVDRLNPILVKECRQALKSRQFTITFALVLVCCWIWSIYGVITVGPGVQFSTDFAGIRMFAGYFAILAFPLLVVVPHGAFRSLADERDDRTFELLSITALGPKQIIAGKLGSAVVQMMVYLSAIMPCLAFTYLLRGIEAPTILIVIVYMFFGSLGLSMIGLLAATLAQERHWQTLWSAAVVVGLGVLFFFVVGRGIEGLTRDRIAFEIPMFWRANAFVALAYLSYFAMFYLAAAARLTFPSENRSTALRVVMFVQQLFLTFACVWIASYELAAVNGGSRVLEAFAIVFLVMISIHWYVMGITMNGEMPRLSNRAKRRLPQSFLGRAFLTWFNPGPASGYVFATANLAIAIGLLIVVVVAFWNSAASARGGLSPTTANQIEAFVYSCLLTFGYVWFYLGLGRLAIGLLRRIAAVGMLLAVLIQILIFLIGTFSPPVIDEVAGNRFNEFRFWHITSLPMTVSALNRQMLAGGVEIVAVVVLGGAFIVFLLNLRGIMAELRQVRAEAPKRVIEEEEALHPKPVAVPVNPFE
jgi:hypothetical protein